MSAAPSPQPKSALLLAAQSAQGFKSLVNGLLVLFCALVVIMTLGHLVTPSLVGPAPAGLWRVASLAAGFWLVFSALWALVSHFARTLSLVMVEVFSAWVATVLTAYVEAQTAQPERPTSGAGGSNVSYLADLLAQRRPVDPTEQG